jgi:5-formyltetrahydrofolate cyclo-ligase
MESWDEIRRWRRARRDELIGCREALAQRERRNLQARIIGLLETHFPELAGGLVGFYWPIRSEIGLHALIRRLVEQGAGAALPVVVEKGEPLQFHAWRPGDRLERGFWNIPVPAEQRAVRPTVLLVPLVGFDGEGYRLGYGGGYYDRTLATMTPRPRAIGVGYELGRLESIHPQPHDIPMDAIVTEAGVAQTPARQVGTPGRASAPAWDEDPNSTGSFASPPCFMHELGPAYLGLEPDRRAEPEGPGSDEGEGDDHGDAGTRQRSRTRTETAAERAGRPPARAERRRS